MFKTIKYRKSVFPLLFSFVLLCCTTMIALGFDDNDYQGYYGYLQDDGGDYPPEDSDPAYCNLTHGIDHDENYWYIVQTETLWKIPIERDLNDVPYWSPIDGMRDEFYASLNILSKPLSSYTALTGLGVNRFAQSAYYKHNGKGYVLCSVYTRANEEYIVAPRYLAVFEAETLNLIDYTSYDGNPELGAMTIASDGTIFGLVPLTISGNVAPPYNWSNRIIRYNVDWEHLETNNEITVTLLPGIPVFDKSGQPLLLNTGFAISSWCGSICAYNENHHSAGCDLSVDEKLFYLATPYLGPGYPSGVYVFNLESGQLIESSTNSVEGEIGYFDLRHETGHYNEYPASLTIWDLDADARSPLINGQLHVLVSQYDTFSDDEIRISHYTNRIYVHSVYAGIEIGTKNRPFNTILEAVNYSWDRSVLIMKEGNYAAKNLTVNKKMKIISDGGPVVIGK